MSYVEIFYSKTVSNKVRPGGKFGSFKGTHVRRRKKSKRFFHQPKMVSRDHRNPTKENDKIHSIVSVRLLKFEHF